MSRTRQFQQPEKGLTDKDGRRYPSSGAEPKIQDTQYRKLKPALDRAREDPDKQAQEKSELMEVAGLQKVQLQSDDGTNQTEKTSEPPSYAN